MFVSVAGDDLLIEYIIDGQLQTIMVKSVPNKEMTNLSSVEVAKSVPNKEITELFSVEVAKPPELESISCLSTAQVSDANISTAKEDRRIAAEKNVQKVNQEMTPVTEEEMATGVSSKCPVCFEEMSNNSCIKAHLSEHLMYDMNNHAIIRLNNGR